MWDEPTTGDIGDFLFARIGEDEREAQRDRYTEPWLVGPFSPGRVGVDAEVTRRLIKEHGPAGYPAVHCVTCTQGDPRQAQPYPCATLRLLAARYRQHRDFNPSWAI